MTRRIVGYYDDSQNRAGTVRYLMELAGALDPDRFQPLLFAPREYGWHADLRALGVEIVTLGDTPASATRFAGAMPPEGPEPGWGGGVPGGIRSRLPLPAGLAWSAGLALELRRLVRLFRRRPVDLLHSNNTGAEVAPIAARLAGIPRVLGTWHVDSTYDLTGCRGGLRYRLLERASMLALHHAIAVSEATQRDWLRRCKLGSHYEERVTVIPNGIDPRRVERQQPIQAAKARYGIPESAIVIGSLGRLEPAKGYEYLLRALPRVIAAEPRVRLLIAGRGPLEGELRELSARLGLAAHVQIAGFVPNVRDVLECMDVYVQPSLCEAQGLAVLEAMALGLPVIASAVGGLPESVDEGLTGYIVPARDAGALAQAACRMISLPEAREEMGRQGRAKVLRQFTQDRMVARTVSLYEEMMRALPGVQGVQSSYVSIG